MNRSILEGLRYQGYSPRTMLDVGANVGGFTQDFLKVFPACVATVIEPNPYCHDDLGKLGVELIAAAASDEAGTAELFLTNEWLQSTGASLYREQTDYFRDEVLVRKEVPKVRLDDLFEGRRFDFVKIDTQGAELDVLKGGFEVLRRADYIVLEVSMIELNAGGAQAEAVFSQLKSMGFRCADVTEVHRLHDVRNNEILQMDFLFEKVATRPTQHFGYGHLHGHDGLLNWLKAQKARCPDFSVIDIGAAANPWSAEVLDATFDMSDCGVAPLHFRGNFNDSRAFDEVLRHVAKNGRFSYCICSHTLEDLAYPAMLLEMLPRIAEAGYIATPSRFLETVRPEGPYRGFIHHRWVLDNIGEDLILAPKLPFLEHLALAQEGVWGGAPERFEFQMTWRGAISFQALNGDYMGPTRDAVVGMFGAFLDRP